MHCWLKACSLEGNRGCSNCMEFHGILFYFVMQMKYVWGSRPIENVSSEIHTCSGHGPSYFNIREWYSMIYQRICGKSESFVPNMKPIKQTIFHIQVIISCTLHVYRALLWWAASWSKLPRMNEWHPCVCMIKWACVWVSYFAHLSEHLIPISNKGPNLFRRSSLHSQNHIDR